MSSDEKDMPIYLRVRRDVRARIDSGEYALGTAIPSENELAEAFHTTRLTVRNAIDALVEEGVVRRVQGKGVFVTGALAAERGRAPQGFREYARSKQMNPSVRLISSDVRPAGAYFSRFFGISADDEVFSVRRLNCVDDIPLTIEHALIPLPLFPKIEHIDISVFSLYEAYALFGHKVIRATEELDLAELSARDAQLLRVEAKSPAMVLECTSFDAQGQPVEFVRSLTRGDLGSYHLRD